VPHHKEFGLSVRRVDFGNPQSACASEASELVDHMVQPDFHQNQMDVIEKQALDQIRTLEGITAWMEVNSEGIYSTRPWKIYGEGPSTQQKIESGNFNEDKQRDLTGEDIRFTRKGNTVYAFVMGKPEVAEVNALGLWSRQNPGKIQQVQMHGRGGEISWAQDNVALRVKVPAELPSDIGFTLKVDFA
jgi:alpha-L-fucosidase